MFHFARRTRGFTPLEMSNGDCKRKSLTGFTLIELMLVVIIIGVLVSMVVPRLAGRTKEAKIAAAKADIEANIALALDLYEVDGGTYPTTEQGLESLRSKPTGSGAPEDWKGPYLKKKPMDPWGNSYKYACPGVHNPHDYDLSSYGPDGVESEDDIVNWEK